MSSGFYEQLGVDATASTGQVRAAYSRAVAALAQQRKALLDEGRDPVDVGLERVSLDEAWSVLSDPVRRRRYDAMCGWIAQPGDGLDTSVFWDRVSPALVHPAAAAAAKLLRSTTHLKEIGAVPISPSAREDEPPTLVPHDEDRTSPRIAHIGTAHPSEIPKEAPLASVVALPNAIAEAPDGSLRIVDGTPAGSSVIMLNSDTRNRRAVSTEDVARLLEQHGHTGALLCAVREARGMTLQELADNTRISVRYLEAIEQDDHGALPSATFVRGYVREMAKQLRLHDPGLVDGYLRRMAE
jgi:hypothetical protein